RGGQRGEVVIDIQHGEQRRRVEMPAVELEQKAQQRIDRLLDALPADRTLVLSARLAGLPGMQSRLNAAGYEVRLLASDAVATGCLAHLGRLRTADTELKLITRLPHAHRVAPAAPRTTQHPTHLLSAHLAKPLRASALADQLRETADGVWLTAGTLATVNGETVGRDRRLCLGDVIDTATGTYTAIRLEG
ncbi:MAG TPA: hypothetical protein VIS76_05580, partial [Pseudomonadales bacterium]